MIIQSLWSLAFARGKIWLGGNLGYRRRVGGGSILELWQVHRCRIERAERDPTRLWLVEMNSGSRAAELTLSAYVKSASSLILCKAATID
jgi:hypothetical protein